MQRLVRLPRFRTIQALLWIGLACVGFASRADAYLCHYTNTCLCQNPRLVDYTQGWQCCQQDCYDPNWPECGRYEEWVDYYASCYTGSYCTILTYTYINPNCPSCGTCP